jgi:peptide deformylase
VAKNVARGRIRAIEVFEAPVLRAVAEPVRVFDAGLAALVADLTATMRAAGGAGLAANQVGETVRVFVYACPDATGTRRSGHVVNPVLSVLVAGPAAADLDLEGCLSLPGPVTRVARPAHVRVVGADLTGRPVTVDGTGMLAVCLAHEVDHLDGRLFVDHLAGRTRRRVLKAYQAPGGPYRPTPANRTERTVVR